MSYQMKYIETIWSPVCVACCPLLSVVEGQGIPTNKWSLPVRLTLVLCSDVDA
jgi:hypothetical protein